MNASTQLIPPLSSNPHLVAVLLIASSQGAGPGPRVVFHYPPNPSLRRGKYGWSSHLNDDTHEDLENDETDSESDDDDDETKGNAGLGLDLETDNPLAVEHEKDYESRKGSGEPGATGEKSPPNHLDDGSDPKHDITSGWDKFLGITKDGLAKLLVPHSRSWNGKKFELSLDDKCFVGCPVFCRKEGGWWKEGKAKAKASELDCTRNDRSAEAADFQNSYRADAMNRTEQSRIARLDHTLNDQYPHSAGTHSKDPSPPMGSAGQSPPPELDPSSTPLPIQIPTSQPRPSFQQISGFQQNLEVPTVVPPSLQSTASNASTVSTGSSTSAYARAYPLKIFNLVFVIAPPTWEHQVRVEAMYNHVVWPLAKLLKDTQKTPMVGESGNKKDTGWLEREVGRIEKACAEAKETGVDYSTFWPTLIRQSPLAQAIATTYNAMSSLSVANVTLGRIEKDPKLCSTFCVQIPQPISVPNAPVPNLSSSQNVPSLPLSTAALTVSGKAALNGFKSDLVEYLDLYDELGIETTAPAAISPHAAILLLKEPSSLLKELSGKSLVAKSSSASSSSTLTGLPSLASTPIAAPLSLLIPCLSPRRTLSQLARSGLPRSISLTDAQILSLELIRQRAARAIPPLHGSNTYVVNPNADMRKLVSASAAYTKRFGAAPLPSLGAILGKLSVTTSSKVKTSTNGPTYETENATPVPEDQDKQIPNISAGLQSPLQPWGALIPSKDHKQLYMNVLSWLMREGWVVQIRTFVWIRVPPDLKKAVAAEQAKEENAKRNNKDHERKSETIGDDRKGRGSGGSGELLSPALAARGRSHDLSRPTSSDGSSSTGSFRTVVSRFGISAGPQRDEKQPQEGADTTRRHWSLSERSDSHTLTDNGKSSTSDDSDSSSELDATTLISSPSGATTLERRWLEYMGTHLPAIGSLHTEPRSTTARIGCPSTATNAGASQPQPPWWWHRLVRYFDGEVAVEDIPSIASIESGSNRDSETGGRETSATGSAQGRKSGKDRGSDSKNDVAAAVVEKEWKWKRKFVDEVVEGLRARGWVVVVRHW
ncbi:MAG: Nitrogen permease regulator 3 [Alyxoria varia]|nr:MAG: Nitrogen permease regulator 3 [Alyxoria varia]